MQYLETVNSSLKVVSEMVIRILERSYCNNIKFSETEILSYETKPWFHKIKCGTEAFIFSFPHPSDSKYTRIFLKKCNHGLIRN